MRPRLPVRPSLAVGLPVLVLLAVAILPACSPGAGIGSVHAGDVAVNTSAREEHREKDAGSDHGDQTVAVEFVPDPFNAFVHWSDLAVVGKVTRASEPVRFDDGHGRFAHAPDVERFGRWATVRVEEVIFEGPKAEAEVGDAIEVFLFGDGTSTGPEYCCGFRENDISGPVSVGDRVLWVLARGGFPVFEGQPPPLHLKSGFQGGWRLEGDTAVNAVPSRSLPTATLKHLLVSERGRARAPEDGSGRFDPREGRSQ